MAGGIGSILAGAIASSLIGAVYLWPAGLAVCKKISNILLIFVASRALALLIITLVAAPSFLPISTALFVIAAAGTSAIALAKKQSDVLLPSYKVTNLKFYSLVDEQLFKSLLP